MTTLVANVPPIRVWVRKEYLYDLQKGHGDYALGYWVTCKSLTGRALYFETYLTEYGALFDKLPISAFLSWDPDYPDKPKEPTPDLALTDLQFWNGFDPVGDMFVFNCESAEPQKQFQVWGKWLSRKEKGYTWVSNPELLSFYFYKHRDLE
jgi:hypothetical protein